MGKAQTKDRLYITASEWSTDFGGAKRARPVNAAGYKPLPFSSCSLTLQPFEHPVCTLEGIVFDLLSIVPWLKQHGINPVTGDALDTKQLIPLHYHKNAEGKYHCPVTFKIFNEHTHIVAIRTSGHVYAYDAVAKLNVEPKNWKDLITDEPFQRKDIITLQDPRNPSAHHDISRFYYLEKGMKPVDADAEVEKVRGNAMSTRILGELKSTVDAKADDAGAKLPSYLHSRSAAKGTEDTDASGDEAHYSTGRAAASLTSTSAEIVTVNERARTDSRKQLYKTIKTKGYATVVTTLGDLKVELFCDQAPQTCHNFILLAKSGYYDGVIFHRNIPGFMVQGGDPTGTGRGGESYWKSTFPDEIHPKLKHTERGLLSMANRGPGTNGSQFFITYQACPHLNGKHSIFGRVVDGQDTLDKMERVQVDKNSRPKEEIKIKTVTILTDPFEDAQKTREQQSSSRTTETAEKKEKQTEQRTAEKPGSAATTMADYARLGFQLTAAAAHGGPAASSSSGSSAEERKKKRKLASDLSNW